MLPVNIQLELKIYIKVQQANCDLTSMYKTVQYKGMEKAFVAAYIVKRKNR